MPHLGGMELLQQIKSEFPAVECIIVTAVDDVSTAMEAVRYGAFDYIIKPLDSDKLVISTKNALEKHCLKKGISLLQFSPPISELKNKIAFASMIAEDENMVRIFHMAEAAAATDYSIIISGETGTGKELLARIIHSLSSRSSGPFIGVNMAAFSRTLFEDSFFGHDKGAFTGASSDKEGLLQSADGGTLFLDEITEMELELQVKLLRVIQEREYIRVGSTRVRNFNTRFITATNRVIDEEIRNKKFRKDLYYRLNMFHIHIPPLRERSNDILPLARHFEKKHAAHNNKKNRPFEKELKQAFLDYSWPGNVREVESIIAKSVIHSPDNMLTLSSVENFLDTSIDSQIKTGKNQLVSLDTLEKDHILKILKHTLGNRTQAAKILDIDLRTLQRKLKKFNI
jgi:DNA-binding NtrC family response regulator